jgi:hypothetical protein
VSGFGACAATRSEITGKSTENSSEKTISRRIWDDPKNQPYSIPQDYKVCLPQYKMTSANAVEKLARGKRVEK